MAMTAALKDELSRLSVNKPCCRKSEVSAILRFAGGLHISGGKISIEVELDTAVNQGSPVSDRTDRDTVSFAFRFKNSHRFFDFSSRSCEQNVINIEIFAYTSDVPT